MRKVEVVWTAVGLAALFGSQAAFAADTHVIAAESPAKWTYNGQSSKPNPPTPLSVADLNAKDILEIQIPDGGHGFMTTRQTGGATVAAPDLVITCDDGDGSSKPNAVLQEIDCKGGTQVGKEIHGTFQLKMLPSFKDDVDFWCTIHFGRMAGILKLKSP